MAVVTSTQDISCLAFRRRKVCVSCWKRTAHSHHASRGSTAASHLEEISRLVGHKSTVVTELVYRKQIRLVLQNRADVMDCIFGPGEDA
jgi:integrase